MTFNFGFQPGKKYTCCSCGKPITDEQARDSLSGNAVMEHTLSVLPTADARCRVCFNKWIESSEKFYDAVRSLARKGRLR